MLIAKCINLDEPVYMCTNTYKVTELELDKEYEVDSVEMYRSYTDIKLKNIDRKFNSVIFEFYENGNEIDIYNDPRYNPYINQTNGNNYLFNSDNHSCSSFFNSLLYLVQ